MTGQAVTALIPMKAHSERVPGKNLRPLCGRPLFHWIVETLLASQRISCVVIDTDSEEIADDAQRNFDVTILMRPERLWGDMVGINELLEHQLSRLAGDVFLQTHSCNPLLTAQTVDRAVDAFLAAGDHDSLFSVTSVRKRFYRPDGAPVNHDPNNLVRTQDLPELLEENSNLYLFTRGSFDAHGHRIGARPILFRVDALEAVDIDEESDFMMAEVLMTRRLAGTAGETGAR